MDDDAQRHGRTLALILGGTAVLLGVVAVVVDLTQGEGFRVAAVVPIAVGLVVFALVRKRSDGR